MRTCNYCGAQNPNSARECEDCGRALLRDVTADSYDTSNSNSYVNYETASSGWWWIGFLFFIAGFILGGVLQPKMPDAAKKAKNGAIVGVVASAVCFIIELIVTMSGN